MTIELTRTLSQEEFDRMFGAAVASLEAWQLHDALDMMEEAVMKRIGSLPRIRKEEKKRNRRRNRRSTKTRENLANNRLRSYEPRKEDDKRQWGNYNEYLKSPEWKGIRIRIFARDSGKCLACGDSADVVHHRGYDNNTMLGRRLHMLISLCNGCHQHVHFLSDGEKVSVAIADIRLSELRINATRLDPPVMEHHGVVDWKKTIQQNCSGVCS